MKIHVLVCFSIEDHVHIGVSRVFRFFSVLFDHAGFSGILLEGDSGARAFGPGATRGRLFGEKKEKRKILNISKN